MIISKREATAIGSHSLVSAVDDHLVLGLPGNVIWASDGTIGGTRPLNVTGLPGQASAPFAFRRVGDRLVFFADDGFHGVEPWSVPWSLVNQHIDADLTGDRIVGFADFLILAHNFGLRDATPDQGDLDRDRTVSFTDFLILADQYAS